MAALQEVEALGTTICSLTEEQMHKSGKLKICYISMACLVGLLRNGADGKFVKIDGLPEDAMILDISPHYKFANNWLTIKVWSDSFDSLPEASTIPELELWCSLWKE